MVQGAYCNGCGRRVQLTEKGECPQGHLRSMLRDVRHNEVVPAKTPPRATGSVVVSGSSPASTQAPTQSHEVLSAVIGKAFVIVPLGAVAVFGLWTGYEQGVGSGMSAWASGLMSTLSLIGTVALAFVWYRFNHRKG